MLPGCGPAQSQLAIGGWSQGPGLLGTGLQGALPPGCCVGQKRINSPVGETSVQTKDVAQYTHLNTLLWAPLSFRVGLCLKTVELVPAVKSWKKDLGSYLLRRKNSAKRRRLWKRWKYFLEGSLSCLRGGSFLGCFWPIISIFGTDVRLHLSAKMDSGWRLLPPFILPLDWGASLHMCQEGNPQECTQSGPSAPTGIPSRSIPRRPVAAAQPGAYLSPTSGLVREAQGEITNSPSCVWHTAWKNACC